MTDQDKQIILEIVIKHLANAHIYLFGSRARKDNSPQSDIDIALDNNTKIDPLILSDIREALEESLIPFTVDIVDFNNISQELKTEILKDKNTWK